MSIHISKIFDFSRIFQFIYPCLAFGIFIFVPDKSKRFLK